MRHELNKAYLEKIKQIYKKANKGEKTKLIDQAKLILELSRKRIIKLLNQSDISQIRPQGRPRLYTEDIAEHLIRLYPMMERICPVRMKAAIPLWIDSYEAHYGLLSDDTKEKLLKVSAATIGRILRENVEKIKGKSSTRVNHKLKKQIPLKCWILTCYLSRNGQKTTRLVKKEMPTWPKMSKTKILLRMTRAYGNFG
jgi:hypothetical protein